MQDSLDHLSEQRRRELKRVVALIHKTTNVEMVVLFGSYARGDQVESDVYEEEGVIYEYASDYDILVVTRNNKAAYACSLLHRLERHVRKDKLIRTKVSFLLEHIDDLNEQLKRGQYFYSDIYHEGIVLYDSRKFQLVEPRQLTAKQRHARAEEDFRQWMQNASEAEHMHQHAVESGMLNWAAFCLHQVTEHLCTTANLVFTGYRPKSHNIEELLERITERVPSCQAVFARQTPAGKRRFDLLRRAYVDARYKKHYEISTEDIDFLAKETQGLCEIVTEACEQEMRRLSEASF